MKKAFLILLISAAGAGAAAQTSLDECIRLACDNYPQVKEMSLIEATGNYDISSAGMAWIPQLSISGKASWQSQVVEMPFEMPGVDFNIPHDQYVVTADLTQQIWDGGATRSRKELSAAGTDVKKKQLETSLYSLKARVENVYLGVILIDQQIELNKLLEKSLLRSKEDASAMVSEGMALSTDLDQISVNILNCLQQRSALESDRQSYLKVLGLLTGRDMTGETLATPETTSVEGSYDFSQRPEMSLYAAQLEQSELQLKQINTQISPKLNLNLQGGYGRPGMNMLSGDFSGYFVAALKFQWNIGALYTRNNDIRKAKADAARIELDRETFLLNSSIEAEQKMNEIKKAQDVLTQDADIISLRKRIRETGETQYKEGAIKMSDFLSLLDEEYKALASESLHRVQLIMSIYDYKNTTGQTL